MESQVIVITGASGGIGAALAQELGRKGHKLVLAARREDRLEAVAGEFGARALAVPTDMTRREDAIRLRDAALATFGQVDGWINNAGRGITRKVLDLTDEDVDAMISINLKSALYGIQAIVPHFQSRGRGVLVNVSSFLGRVPLASVRSAYSAAKAALNSLTANLRMDLRVEYPDIHVCLVMPGMVATDFARNSGDAAIPAAAAAHGSQTADEVAAQIADLIEDPVPELYTRQDQKERVRTYIEDVAAFERNLAAWQPAAR